MYREMALKLSSSFGGGMGKLREVCGAVSAMFMIAGVKYGYSDPKDIAAKTKHYQRIQALAERFKAENGSIVCRELLGLPKCPDQPVPEERTQSYYQKRPCVQLVKCAAKIMKEYLEENQVFQHFGKCLVFTVFTVENGTIQERTPLDASRNGHAALSGFLKGEGVDTVICGGIGDGAKQMLSSAGIRLISGITGSIDDAVRAYLSDSLSDQGGACRHEEQEETHVCSCGNRCR